jgi:hypothetical protein
LLPAAAAFISVKQDARTHRDSAYSETIGTRYLMCGIAGYKTTQDISPSVLQNMVAALVHRGESQRLNGHTLFSFIMLNLWLEEQYDRIDR